MKKSLRLSLLLLTALSLLFTAVKAQSPVFSTTPTTKVYVGQPYSYAYSASDTNNSAITYAAPTLPGWLTNTPGQYSTSFFAGSGTSGSTDATGTAASFYNPWNLTVDAGGNIFVSDFRNGLIRKITSQGVVTTLAAGFSSPVGVTTDNNGNVYVLEDYSTIVKKVDASGNVSILASGLPYSRGIAFSPDGNLYACGQGTFTRVSLSGLVTPITLSGQTFSYIYDLGFDASGNAYVGDYNNNQVKKITPAGVVSTFAAINNALGIDVDHLGNVYAINYNNGDAYKISPTGVVTAILNSGTRRYGIAVNADATAVYVSEIDNHRINRISISDSQLTGTPTLANIGRHPVSITASNATNTTNQDFNIDVYGPSGNALHFDGPNAAVNLNSSIPFGSSYTKEAWVHVESSSGNKSIISSSSDPFFIYNGSLYGGNATNAFAVSTDMPSGRWVHVALTYNSSSDVMTLYKNGVFAASSTVSHNSSGENIFIGNQSGLGIGLNGKIDNVRIWSVALSESSIRAGLVQDITSGSGLLASYNFDQGIAGGDNTGITVLYDGSVNNRNGIIQNFAMSSSSPLSNFDSSYAMVVPTATAASNLTVSGFTANWTAPTVGSASSYILEYATNSTFTANVASVTVNALTYNVTNVRPGTTYYYRVSAVSGTTEVGGYSNVISATTTVLAPPGNALAMNGASNRVIIGAAGSAATNFAPTDAFTIETWIKPNSFSGNPAIFTHKQTGVDSDGYGFFFESTGKLYLETKNSGVASDLRATAGKWNHVAVTYNAAIAKFYLNGQLAGISTVLPTNLTAANITAVIGSFDNPNYFMNGSFDELKVYKKELSQTEIQTDMNQVGTLSNSDLVLYYNFDQGIANSSNSGITTLYDQSPNAYNGTLTSMTLTGTASNWVSSYAVITPNATAASNITVSGFTANWAAPATGTVSSYELEYSPSASFASSVTIITGITGTSFATANLRPSPVYYYRLRAVSGTEIGGYSNTISATTTTLAPPGNALAFDGVDDKVVIGSTNTFDATTMRTVEVWAKFKNFNGAQELISKSTGSKGLELLIFNNNLSAYIMGNGQDQHIDIPASRFQLEKWYHFALTHNGSASTLTLYIDGEVAGTVATPAAMENSLGALQLGSWAPANDRQFMGTLDEVKVWSTLRSQSQIKADMLEANPSNASGLLAYYNFDHGVALGNNLGVTTLYDQSINNVDGTLVNFGLTAGAQSNWVSSYAMVVPTATAATSITTNSFTANWTAPTTGTATSYEVDYATVPSFTTVAGTVTTTTNSVSITNIAFGTAYYYRVRAVSGAEIGANSNIVTLTTDKVDQTITLASTSTVTYGAADYALGATSTNSGIPLVYGVSDASVATVTTNGTVQILKAGTVTITVSQAGDAQHNAASTVTQTLNINKKALVLTATAPSRTYDATTNATATLAVNGMVNGNIITASATSATFNDKTVATGKTVTVTGIAIAGTNADSYSFAATVTTAATITVRSLAVSTTATNKVYDGNALATVGISDNRVLGDALSVSYTSSTFNDKAVATGKTVTVSGISISGADAANYVVNTTATTTANITLRSLAVSTTATNKVYDGSVSATVGISDNRVMGDALSVSYTSSTFNDKTVATGKTVTVSGISISGADAANYVVNTTATTTANITVRSLAVSTTATNKVYDGNVSATVGISDNRVLGDALSVSYTSSTFNDKTVATGKTVTVSGVSISGTDAANYVVNTTATTTANITLRSLAVSTTATNKVYDGNVSATVGISDNRVLGDALSVSYTSSTFNDKTAATGKTVTVSGISISGTDAANYVVNTTATTTANITARALTVNVAGVNKIYDGTTSATVTYSDNRVNGDILTVSIGTAAFNNKNVAIGKTVTATNISISGTDAANYMVNATATTTANITARTLVVAATASDKVYDGNVAATAALADNRVKNDVLSTSYATAIFNNANAGTNKAVVVTGIAISGTDAANYTANTTAATAASITPRVLTITADNKTRLQGVANPTFTATFNGFITGENSSNALTVQPSLSTTATLTSPQGNYAINVSGAVATNGNYSFNYVNGVLTVTPGIPTGITLVGTTVYENRPIGILAGTLGSTAPDPNAVFSYSLVAGVGSADNAKFSISGNQLLTAAAFDYEAQSSFNIRVRTTTQYGLSLEQVFVVNINDVNEAPTMDAVNSQTICYTAATQTIALTGITSGPENAQNVTMTVTTNNPGLFRNLVVTKGNGTNGTLTYSISNGWQGTATVSIVVKDDGGTANSGADTYTRTFNITVNPLPIVTIWSSSGINSVSKGETISLKADAPGAASYSWATANGIISGQNTSTLTIRPMQTTTYTVTAFNATGCSESKQITIEVRSDFNAVKANNILTPNGDGSNDTWIIANIDQYPNAEVKVIDRSGRLVYSRKAYDNSWNGTYNGTVLNEGAYLYVIDFGNGLYKAKGTLTILHNR